jgi:Ubiquitin fusion degradation protein 2
MYTALIYRALAAEAEANMEAVTPPLFLRFVNLLMNDAVFLLDEALSNMAQLRQMQTAREAGEWQQLTSHEHEQNEGYMEHIGMITRFGSSCIYMWVISEVLCVVAAQCSASYD